MVGAQPLAVPSHTASFQPNHIPLSLLQQHYDAIVLSYGADSDKDLSSSVKGLELAGVYSARAFVGWYNGHPEFQDLDPDVMAGEQAVVVGHGNVALDVARILLTDVDALRKTDITEAAIAKLSENKVKRVRIVGRRGPAQVRSTIRLHEMRINFNCEGVVYK
jgi:adrenodoxin-NADP+ reductase